MFITAIIIDIVTVGQAFLYVEYPATQRLPINQTSQEDKCSLALR